MKHFFQFIKLFISYIDGDFAYKNYLDHHKKHHPLNPIIDKKTFLKQKQQDRYKSINRCC